MLRLIIIGGNLSKSHRENSLKFRAPPPEFRCLNRNETEAKEKSGLISVNRTKIKMKRKVK